MDERFTYYYPSQIIKDKQTGERHYGNKSLADLLNKLHEENEDRFNEQMYLQKQLHNTQKELEPIRKICKKYRIPIKDLPEILEEYIAYDNDDDW